VPAVVMHCNHRTTNAVLMLLLLVGAA